MSVQVVIPWRSGCPHREAALTRVLRWWSDTHPDWPVTVGTWPAERGPWRKGMALATIGRLPSSDVVIMSDADVICRQVDVAVKAINGPVRWAVPHRTVYRLSETATGLVTTGAWFPPREAVPDRRRIQPYVVEIYNGSPGGGLVVMTGEVFNTVPIDPRFAGYGQEDHSWALALHRTAGAPMRGQGALWHLWHQPQERMRLGDTVSRGIGSRPGLELWHRYRSASTPALMQGLLDEARVETERMIGET